MDSLPIGSDISNIERSKKPAGPSLRQKPCSRLRYAGPTGFRNELRTLRIQPRAKSRVGLLQLCESLSFGFRAASRALTPRAMLLCLVPESEKANFSWSNIAFFCAQIALTPRAICCVSSSQVGKGHSLRRVKSLFVGVPGSVS